MKHALSTFILFFSVCIVHSQSPKDSLVNIDNAVITLKEVVIDTKLNTPSFINRIKNDTSYYKAFKNLRVLNFSAINDIRMLNRKGDTQASLHNKTRQRITNNCRSMQTMEEAVSGDMYKGSEFNYYTAQLYASLFFTKGSICGETNIVGNADFSPKGTSGMEKHKQQLKMLFFNPGHRIEGIPFLSNKTAIFDNDIVNNYDMTIDMDFYNKTSCYVFKQKVKPGNESDVVVDEMTTWFDDSTFEVVARNYSLSFDAGIYDFKVNMEVQMTRVNHLLVPSLIRYNGNWKAIFKRRERGVFTATLFDFE